MALIFVDGFDHYATADISKKWNSTVGTPTISAAAGRRGGGALVSGSSGAAVGKAFAAGSSFVAGMALKLNNSYVSQLVICQLIDGVTAQCSLVLNPDMTIAVVRGSATAVTGGTSVAPLVAGATNYIEWKVTIADSIAAGSCVVRVNGVDVITVATGQDLKATSNATATQFYIGAAVSGSGTSMGTVGYVVDDFYLCDQSGSVNNNFLGDCRVDTLLPNADGTYSQFTPSTGTTHYTLVDEAAPNTTDYNDGANVGDRDSYGLANLSALVSQTIYGVQTNAAVWKDDAGAKSAATFVRSGGNNGDGASVALGTTSTYLSQVFETDPNGAIAWTESSVNAMEAGVKVTA